MKFNPRGRVACALLMAGVLALMGVAACDAVPGDREGRAVDQGPYQGTPLEGAASDFRLIDQDGVAMALSDLLGRVVVLSFLDPNCTDACPLIAFHYRLASEALGSDAEQVAFLAVNANPEFTSVEDVGDAGRRWGAEAVPSWRFLTGDAEELREVWAAYDIHAGTPKHGKPGEVDHSMGVLVIDRAGQKRWYISMPLLSQDWDGPPLADVIAARVEGLLAE